MSTEANPVGLCGLDFIEYCGPNPQMLHDLFTEFGFTKTMTHGSKQIDYYKQNDIHFLVNKDESTFGAGFSKLHGPSVCSMGWRVVDAKYALEIALERGAKKVDGDFEVNGTKVPAIYGIGDSIIYFIEDFQNIERYSNMGFNKIEKPENVENKGFIAIDHLTNNVEYGTMSKWSDFYKNIFGFTEIKYFDIKGAKTGLTSFALKSPCSSFSIPINEAKDQKSQINEYLEEYNGPGIQHIAFISHDILNSLDKLKNTSIQTLDIDDEYYEEVWGRVPNVTENKDRVKEHQVLVDGDEAGYLLQIFTKNLIGPIFIEIIQRKNHFAFGEGNFGALFRSIERDQQKRGYLD